MPLQINTALFLEDTLYVSMFFCLQFQFAQKQIYLASESQFSFNYCAICINDPVPPCVLVCVSQLHFQLWLLTLVYWLFSTNKMLCIHNRNQYGSFSTVISRTESYTVDTGSISDIKDINGKNGRLNYTFNCRADWLFNW